jgi:hypothetical protein
MVGVITTAGNLAFGINQSTNVGRDLAISAALGALTAGVGGYVGDALGGMYSDIGARVGRGIGRAGAAIWINTVASYINFFRDITAVFSVACVPSRL